MCGGLEFPDLKKYLQVSKWDIADVTEKDSGAKALINFCGDYSMTEVSIMRLTQGRAK
jgi:hypothetical protein